MGVKVRLADAREVNDKAHKAGDVVEVDPGDARLLVAIGAGVRVADVMTAHPHTAPADITIEDFIQRYLLGDRHSAYPVADRDGSIIGLITLGQLRGIAPSQRAATLVREAAIPLPRVPTAAPHEPRTASSKPSTRSRPAASSACCRRAR